MKLLDLVSLVVGFYFYLGFLVENLSLGILIWLNNFCYLDKIVEKAVIRSGCLEIKRIQCSDKFLFSLFVLRWGFTETMLEKLCNYLSTDEINFIIDGKDIFRFYKMHKTDKKYKAVLNTEDFEFCAGDILI